jgi:alpha-1,2-mannosyltransferase
VRNVSARALTALPGRLSARWLLAAGVAAFAAVIASYLGYLLSHPAGVPLDPVDLGVYRSGGLIARHVRPPYQPGLASPLYDWRAHSASLRFTYPPFAALVFALVSLVPWPVLPGLTAGASIACLVAALWFTARGLGYRGSAGAGAALLAAAAVFWTEPVIRTLYLGQVNLVLMALILWDLCQPGSGASRWWRGAGVGVAAGIKLVPLIFVPYLLLTRRFRQAAVAGITFAITVAAGFALLPADSRLWWLHGLFADGGRTGFAGWEGNQSLRGLITRLGGSVAATGPAWLVTALVTGAAGLACAAVLDRAGHRVAGVLACALTGLLISPVSWDHHWVWVAPGALAAAHYAARALRPGGGGPGRLASRWRAAGWAALAAGMIAWFLAWPVSLPSGSVGTGSFALGLLWLPPNTNPVLYYRLGDRPWYPEYHWHGSQLLTGNAYLLAGLALLVLLLVAAARSLAGPPALAEPARRPLPASRR